MRATSARFIGAARIGAAERKADLLISGQMARIWAMLLRHERHVEPTDSSQSVTERDRLRLLTYFALAAFLKSPAFTIEIAATSRCRRSAS